MGGGGGGEEKPWFQFQAGDLAGQALRLPGGQWEEAEREEWRQVHAAASALPFPEQEHTKPAWEPAQPLSRRQAVTLTALKPIRS